MLKHIDDFIMNYFLKWLDAFISLFWCRHIMATVKELPINASRRDGVVFRWGTEYHQRCTKCGKLKCVTFR